MAPKNIKLSKIAYDKLNRHHKSDGLKISKQHPNAYVEEHCIYKGGKKEKCDLIVFEEKHAKKNWHVEYNIKNGERHNFHMVDLKAKKGELPPPPKNGNTLPIHGPLNTASQENYFNCPCAHNVEGQHTGHPLTSHETKKFNNSVTSRSDYDQYWLKVYNTYTDNVNYNLA